MYIYICVCASVYAYSRIYLAIYNTRFSVSFLFFFFTLSFNLLILSLHIKSLHIKINFVIIFLIFIDIFYECLFNKNNNKRYLLLLEKIRFYNYKRK